MPQRKSLWSGMTYNKEKSTGLVKGSRVAQQKKKKVQSAARDAYVASLKRKMV